MTPVIQVRGLSKQFGDILAVNDLSFNVFEGDVYGFLGQNGAGKSTTIRMLLTLIQPTSGEIDFFGTSLSRCREKILRETGAVVEKPDVYKYLTAYENLEMFAKLSGVKRNRNELMEELNRVGLSERAHSKVKTYSQGMKQRLGIAIALVHDPKIIILDEPTNGLDPQGIADIRNLIIKLSQVHKKTVVVSSHLLSEIEQIATRMLIIDKGRKIAEGNVSELFDPEDILIELDTTNNMNCREILQNSEWSATVTIEKNGKLRGRMNRKDVPRFNKWLVENGVEVLSLHQQNSLEEYFLAITSGNNHVAGH
jgi:ABC-type multidrug transport system ATPase subunit